MAIFTSYTLIGRNINTDSILDIDYRFLRNFYSTVTSDDVNGFSKAPLSQSVIFPHSESDRTTRHRDFHSFLHRLLVRCDYDRQKYASENRLRRHRLCLRNPLRARSRYDHVFAYLDVKHALSLVVHDKSNVRSEHRPDERQTSAVRLVTRSPFLRS